MTTSAYPFQIDRISFFENDTQAQIEVQFIADSLRFNGELIMSNTSLNKLINALIEKSTDVFSRLSSYVLPGEGKLFEIDLRDDLNKPILNIADLSDLGELKQIRA